MLMKFWAMTLLLNPDDKTLFEAASGIIKLGERETPPWIRLLDKAVG
jgi:hypothetical protein